MTRILVVLFFLFPYLYLMLEIPGFKVIDLGELMWALANSLKQSVLSAALGCAFGFWMALGLNRLERHHSGLSRLARAVLLLPSFLPPFFIILTFLSWVQPFPFGVVGVVLVHFPMMAGFAAVIFQRQINDKLAALAQVALVLGAGRWLFWRQAVGLLRREIFSLFGFLLIWAFTSFSIPLVLGGGRGTTLEILIFEKIRISGDWGAALSLSMIQSLLIALMLISVPTAKSSLHRIEGGGSGLLRSRVGLGLVVLFSALFVIPWIWLSWPGWSYLWGTEGMTAQVLSAASLSFRIGALVGVLSLLVLSLISLGFGSNWFQNFLRSYFPPSASLLGLCGLGVMSFLVDIEPGYFLLGGGREVSLVVYLVLLVLFFAPSLYRLGLDARLTELDEQIQEARVLGGRRWRIFQVVVLPQIWPRLCLLSALAGLWAVGDFALAKFFFESGETLPLMIENLMGSYRIDPALSLGHVVFAIGALIFIAFWRLGHVFDS